MKNIKEQIAKLISTNAKSNWTKGVLWAILICFIVFVIANTYLLFRPLSNEVKGIIDGEINSSNINFDQKTIDALKTRQVPNSPTVTPGGKNPFTSL
jgi:hypothetical protein